MTLKTLFHSSLVAVVARFRPPNKTELASGGDIVVNFDSDETCSLNVWIPSPGSWRTKRTELQEDHLGALKLMCK